ncbi:hypothetical protein C2845_PM04G19450 [Panicum miliaceum]|uniref:Caffeoyl-CoA O-methyltransferase n=1 Tax=Panicum miliaceum TaxID=4540 RepID=A0A3L6QVQ9_PANMI|nr:hypothetical protein C2845_PM04G19450 [Panicum miliaceum]
MAATGAGEGNKAAAGPASLHSKTLLKSEPLYQYILESTVFPREPDCLRELRLATASHPMAAMAASPDEVQLFGLLLEMLGARNAIEVGVFTGSWPSTLPARARIGSPVIEKAGVAHKVDSRVGLALPVLDQMVAEENKGAFDFAFVDADKVNFLNYHERLLQLVRVGGLIAYDNTLWGGSVVAIPDEPLAAATREFNAAIAADRRVRVCQLAVANGLTLCRRVA